MICDDVLQYQPGNMIKDVGADLVQRISRVENDTDHDSDVGGHNILEKGNIRRDGCFCSLRGADVPLLRTVLAALQRHEHESPER